MDYAKAFKRPFTNAHEFFIGFLSLLVLTALPVGLQIFLRGNTAISISLTVLTIVFNFLLAFLITGYGLYCAKTAMKNKFPLPSWSGYKEYLLRGFMAMILALVYITPVLAIALVAFGASVASLIAGQFNTYELRYPSVTTLVAVVLFLILVSYITYSAVLMYARNWKFLDGLNLKKVVRNAFTIPYFLAVVVGWIYSLVLTVITIGVFLSLSFVNYSLAMALYVILISAVTIITTVTAYTLLGMVYQKNGS